MTIQSRITFYTLLVTLLVCCRNAVPVGDTSRNALDWQGTYHGMLPCADCQGILAMIQLNKDNTFIMSTSYLGKSDTGQRKTGSFTWDDSGREITLKGLSDSTPPVYKVGENKLIPVHRSITAARAGQYSLTKNSNDITNRYWRLIKLNDNPVILRDHPRKVPHLIFLSTENTVIGNGACNNFRGTYETTANNAISFSPLAATKMACMENMDVENQLLKNLMEVSSYQVSGDSLFLFNDQKMKSVTFTLTHFN